MRSSHSLDLRIGRYEIDNLTWQILRRHYHFPKCNYKLDTTQLLVLENGTLIQDMIFIAQAH